MSAAALRFDDEPEFNPEDERFNREYIRGEEMMSPRPAKKHAGVSSRLLGRLSPRFDSQNAGPSDPGGWMIIHEPELKLEGGPLQQPGVVPDVAGWRELRAPEEDDEAAYRIAPDWVCEVLSPSTRTWDQEKKMPFYAYHRVGHLWLVDPVARELEVYALGRRGWESLGIFSQNAVRAEPFETVELDLTTIWPRKNGGPRLR